MMMDDDDDAAVVMGIRNDDIEDNYKWHRNRNLLSISVCIMINLGWLQYRKGALRDAIGTYECALELSQRLVGRRVQYDGDDEDGKDDPLTGCILNCLGVLHYHILSESTLSSSSASSSSASPSASPSPSPSPSPTLASLLLPLKTLSIKDRNMSWSTANTNTSRTTTTTNTSTTTMNTTSIHQNALQYFQLALQHQTSRQNLTIGTIHNNIGRLHASMHNYTLALSSYQKALTIRATTLGMGSLDYAATAFNAGQSYHQLGLYSEALPLYLVFWKVGRRVLPESHRDMAIVLSGIAQILQRTRKAACDKDESKKNEEELEIEIETENVSYQTILSLYQRSLNSARHAFGTSDHPEIAMIYNRIGNFYFESNEKKLAAETYCRGLEIERNVLEDGHKNIVVTLYNLGEIYRRLSDDNDSGGDRKWLKRALKCYEEILAIQRRKRRIVASGQQQRHLHCKRKRRRNIKNYNNIVEATNHEMKKEIDEVDTDIGTTLYILGTTYDRLGDETSALHHFQSSLLTRRNVLGNAHVEVASTLTSIGSFYLRKSMRLGYALDLFREALEIRLAAAGSVSGSDGNKNNKEEEENNKKDNHYYDRDIALSWYNVALIHWRQGSYEDAVKALEETLRIEQKVFGGDHKDVAITLCRLGEVCRDMHSTDQALNYFGQAMDIQKKFLVRSSAADGGDAEGFGSNTQATAVDDNNNGYDHGINGGTTDDVITNEKDIIALARTCNEIGNLHLTKGNTAAMMDAFARSARYYRDVANASEANTLTTTTGTDDVVVHNHLYGLHYWSLPGAAPAA